MTNYFRRGGRLVPWVLAAVLVLHGCAAHQGQAGRTALSPERLRGPAVWLDGSKLAASQAQACTAIQPLLVPADQRAVAAREAGVLTDDFEALVATTGALHVIVTLRDSNPACEPHLRAGMESKGHDVLTKTFTAESLPDGFKDLAGTVSTLPAKPGPGVILSDPRSKQYLTKDGQPLTGDYDLMDMLWPGGRRITGESADDLRVREALNAGLPLRGSPPHRVDRIKHGAQAEYPNYLRAIARQGRSEEPHPELDEPESPLTALAVRDVYRLPRMEDVMNFYRCEGAPLPPEWNVKVRNQK